MQIPGLQDLDKVIAEILGGKQCIISYPGISQYQSPSRSSNAGVSACGLAALNCARTIFRLCEGYDASFDVEGQDARKLLKAVLCQQTTEEILSICSLWPSSDHLEVDELLEVPLFKQNFDEARVRYALTEHANFMILLDDMSTFENVPVAAVITRTPEIVICLKIPSTLHDIFIVFDSHPRPSHPSGSGFTVSLSPEEAAAYLYRLLALDSQILQDPTMRWQAQLFGQFSSHMIVPKSSLSSLESVDDVLMDASMTILQLKADIADFKRREADLMAENHDLAAQVAQLELSQQREVAAVDIKGKKPCREAQSTTKMLSSLSSSEGRRRISKRSEIPSFSRFQSKYDDRETGNISESDLEAIVQLQIQYNEEDKIIKAERASILDNEVATFRCTICFDEMQVDHIVQLASCMHCFCRDCLRGHVTSTIDQGRYPVSCPVCIANNVANPSNLDDDIFSILGLTEPTLEKIQSFQLAPYSIVLHCRKCKESMFVDRKDHQGQNIITCPLRGCNYSWCKNCEQPIDIGGPQHSCDGSSELKNLMQKRGWRHCPGCQTPFQKETGCNHMTCMVPGCNTHFCYICGEMMTQSSVRSEIKNAISAHYRRCQMFEEVPDTDA